MSVVKISTTAKSSVETSDNDSVLIEKSDTATRLSFKMNKFCKYCFSHKLVVMVRLVQT